jgi:hypothetical protein
MSAEDWSVKPGDEPIEFSAKRGGEDLFVQVVHGWEDENPALMFVVLKVRLGPDAT